MTAVRGRAAGLLVLVAAAAGVLVLRDELMTVHVPEPPGTTTEVVLEARTRDSAERLEPLTRALVESCRLVAAPGGALLSFETAGSSRFVVMLAPALDEYDRRELKGCLQDLRGEHLLVEVRRLRTVPAG